MESPTATALQEAIADQLLTKILQSHDIHRAYQYLVEGLQKGLAVDRVLLVQQANGLRTKNRIVAQAKGPNIAWLRELDLEADSSWFPLLAKLPQEKLWTVALEPEQDSVQWQFCRALGVKSLLYLPLAIEGRPWGNLSLHDLQQCRPWTRREQAFAQRLGRLFCLGLTKTELWLYSHNQKASLQAIISQTKIQKETYTKAAQREKTLADVIDKIRLTLDLRTLFQTTVTEVLMLLGAERVVIIKITEGLNSPQGEIQAEANVASTPRGQKLCPLSSQTKLPLAQEWVDHFRKGMILAMDDRAEPTAPASDAMGPLLGSPKANLVVPLFSGDRLWGLLSIHECGAPRVWESSEIEFALKIALNLGVALQQAELLAESQRRSTQLQRALGEVEVKKDHLTRLAQEERALNRLIEGIRQSLDLETIFRVTTEEVRHLLSCDRVLVYRFNPDWSGDFIFESVAQIWEPLVGNANKLPTWEDTYLQETEGGRYRFHESLRVEDVETAGFTDCHLEILHYFEIRAFLTVPVFVGEQLWGILAAYQNGAPRHWQLREQYLVEQVANQLGVAVYQAQLLAKFQEQSKTMANTLADLTAIVDNLADGLLVINVLGKITRYNPALLAMFDLEGLDLRGARLESYFPATLNQLMLKPEREQEKIITADVKLSRGRQGQALVTNITCGGDGQGQPQCLGSVVMIRDVTREREVERIKTDFLATVSHELRTPLTSVLGFATVIQDKLARVIFPEIETPRPRVAKAMEQALRNLAIIEAEADRLTMLVNDVLDIAKMEAGQEVWAQEILQIEPIIQRAIATIKPQAETKNIVLTTAIAPDLPNFLGDENRILQVVLNLLSNAVKFTGSGVITAQAYRCEDKNQYLTVAIIDNGPGIRVADQRKIFEPFQQGGNVLTDKPQGTGLGLPICKKIIEHHGGHIGVISDPGQGSTFFFCLPIFSGPPPPTPGNDAPPIFAVW